jgi:formylglycine-generating enzyme required for sulfatase activity
MDTNPSFLKGNNLPIENVSWDDIKTFLTKLNAKTGKNYRLPTEAEWEYAARGGSKSNGYRYSGSNDVKSVAWMCSNIGMETQPIGQLQANELNIYDMSGNVWAWSQDWYKGYAGNSGVSDYTGSLRVHRGGSWMINKDDCRSTLRSSNTPTFRNCHLGFRLAISSLQ